MNLEQLINLIKANCPEFLKNIGFYSIGFGVVALDKPSDTDEIYVYLPGTSPTDDGEIIANLNSKSVSSEKMDGSIYQSQVLESNVQLATWFRDSNNRITSPDVRRGAKVILYRMLDKKELYWRIAEYDDRALENVIYGFNANPNIDKTTPFSYDDFYVFEINTYTGKIKFRTSRSNGEPVGYNFVLDTKQGTYTSIDTEENTVHLNSKERNFLIRNKDNTAFDINKKVVTITCKDLIQFNATNKIYFKTKDMVLDIDNDYTANIGNNYNLNIKGNYTLDIKGTSTSDVGKDTTHTSPTTTFNTELTNNGNVAVNGNMTVAGGVNCIKGTDGGGGSMECDGDINTTGDVVAGGVSLRNHTHSNDGNGPPNK